MTARPLVPRRCPEALWEELAQGDPSATMFQTPAWHRVAANHSGAEIHPLLFELPGGAACLPLLRERRWGRWRWFSPFGTYSALLSSRALADDETLSIEKALQSLTLQLTSSPFTRTPLCVGRPMPSRTQVIDLEGFDPDDPARDWAPDPRRKLRRARDVRVRVRLAGPHADWDAYDAIYRKSLDRWGSRATSAYPPALFMAIRTLPAACARLWLAEHDGRVAAGYIEFRHNQHACIWHGASDPSMFATGAVQALYAAMLSGAAREGYPRFDLLGSGGVVSLERFKAGFGARVIPYSGSISRPGLVGMLAEWRDRMRGRFT